jgi:hypothetical protein
MRKIVLERFLEIIARHPENGLAQVVFDGLVLGEVDVLADLVVVDDSVLFVLVVDFGVGGRVRVEELSVHNRLVVPFEIEQLIPQILLWRT